MHNGRQMILRGVMAHLKRSSTVPWIDMTHQSPPAFASVAKRRLVCTGCGGRNAHVMPDWPRVPGGRIRWDDHAPRRFSFGGERLRRKPACLGRGGSGPSAEASGWASRRKSPSVALACAARNPANYNRHQYEQAEAFEKLAHVAQKFRAENKTSVAQHNRHRDCVPVCLLGHASTSRPWARSTVCDGPM
jgi:hypothetical protein